MSLEEELRTFVQITGQSLASSAMPALAAQLAYWSREYDAAVSDVAETLGIDRDEAGARVRQVWTERPVRDLAEAALIVIGEGLDREAARWRVVPPPGVEPGRPKGTDV